MLGANRVPGQVTPIRRQIPRAELCPRQQLKSVVPDLLPDRVRKFLGKKSQRREDVVGRVEGQTTPIFKAVDSRQQNHARLGPADQCSPYGACYRHTTFPVIPILPPVGGPQQGVADEQVAIRRVVLVRTRVARSRMEAPFVEGIVAAAKVAVRPVQNAVEVGTITETGRANQADALALRVRDPSVGVVDNTAIQVYIPMHEGVPLALPSGLHCRTGGRRQTKSDNRSETEA